MMHSIRVIDWMRFPLFMGWGILACFVRLTFIYLKTNQKRSQMIESLLFSFIVSFLANYKFVLFYKFVFITRNEYLWSLNTFVDLVS